MDVKSGGIMRRRVLLVNSAMMPALTGSYIAEELTKDEFVKAVQEAEADGILESYIGYDQTAEQVSKWTGMDIPINRTRAEINDLDIMLVIRLKFRPGLNTKGLKIDPADFEFARVYYTSVMAKC